MVVRCLMSVGLPCLTVAAALGASAPSFAATFEQIQQSCRETVGRPIVQACMQAQPRGTGNLEACRTQATPAVRACIQKEMSKIAATKAAPAAPIVKDAAKETGEVAPAVFVAPPRTIADITAILDQEKPDPAKLAKLRADADAEPARGLSKTALAQFYYDRGNARAALGRTRDALADAEKSLEIAQGGEFRQVIRIRQFVGMQHNALGDPKKAVETFQVTVREGNQPGRYGSLINAQRNIAVALVLMGDLTQAESYIRRNATLVQDARGSPHPNWRKAYDVYGRSWEADADEGKALIFEARGQFKEAEAALVRAEAFRRASIKDLPRFDFPPPREQIIHVAARNLATSARVKARQGRLSEAEVDARRALLEVLNTRGKYNPVTTAFVIGLATVLVEQGRYPEAEQLTRAALDIQRTLGVGDDTQTSAQILSQLGGILNLQRKWPEAAAVYADLDKAIAKWEPQRRQVLELNGARIYSLYASGQVQAGLAAAQALLTREIGRVGEKHFDTAAARGTLAVGYMRSGREAEAMREFRAAIPIMMAASRENADDDDTTVIAARKERLQNVVEPYMQLVSKAPPEPGRDVAAETFSLADAVRGRSVQQALASSSARMVVKDAALAELVRKEQDLAKQINAQLGALNNVLALPSSERDEAGVRAINAAIDKDRGERAKAQQEIARRFPAYADLVDPKPPTVEQIKATLAPGEAFLSFYFGRDASFVWAVPKEGTVAFATVQATSGELQSKIRTLREALEPQATMISDIPAFDVALGYELYSLLLKPVERGWKSAKDLIVVTNGALGLLPLSLLPTAPTTIAAVGDTPFAEYRNVPWLARTHAVSMVPSAAALRTLRQLPPGKPSRSPLVAFGDPFFSEEQAKEAESTAGIALADASNVTRGIPLKRRNVPQLEGVDSAELALLPRLSDTADELKSIAAALQADPSKVLHLGKEANETKVKSLDLSGFKVLAFATHGLLPGELNGLTQPALALTAPSVAGVAGDGLLTMEEILALKLDADWVVLSACNTGAGAGAGAEAASGLGRAFFYAGTRALLVTNWSVHSQSARELVTDMFKRQADDTSVTRAEALRQAMLQLVDGKGYADDQGQTRFAYAHPLFWAPYTIIGDGGRR
jgi:CHAT domain-containing protein/tetratricopeptide (TPR) repeat protein